jgi:hypothetical protein
MTNTMQQLEVTYSPECYSDFTWRGFRDGDELDYVKKHPNWEVHVHGRKVSTGRRTWCARIYVVPDNNNSTILAHNAKQLAIQSGIKATNIYIGERTSRPVDPRLTKA